MTFAQDWQMEVCSNIFELLYSAQIHVGMDDMVHSNWKLNKMAVLAFVHTMSILDSDNGYKGCFLCVNCDSGEYSHGRQPY